MKCCSGPWQLRLRDIRGDSGRDRSFFDAYKAGIGKMSRLKHDEGSGNLSYKYR
jgi:hypothetical protein